jgi:hypothetical protein
VKRPRRVSKQKSNRDEVRHHTPGS